MLVVPAAHGPVEHLHGEHGVTIVAEDKEVPELQAMGAGKMLPAAP